MNIAIITFSLTGHTQQVADQLAEQLRQKGHQVSMEKVTAKATAGSPRSQGTAGLKLDYCPDPGQYEGIVLASFVEAFSLNQLMKKYLEQLPSLQGKKAAILITKQLPFMWTGGNRAIKQMSKILEAKGAEMLGSGAVIWSGQDKETKIAAAVQHLAELI